MWYRPLPAHYLGDDMLMMLLGLRWLLYRISEPIRNKICASIWHYFTGYTIFHKYYFNCIGEVLRWQSFQPFDNGEFAVVIYNTQIVFIIIMKHITPNYLPWSEGYIMMHNPFLGLCWLKLKACRTLFNIFVDISIYAGPVHTFLGQ